MRLSAPLAADLFHRPTPLGEHTSYLCGHSLGPQPVAAQAELEAISQQWRDSGVQAWFREPGHWAAMADEIRASLAKIVGAQPQSVGAVNNLSSNIQQLLLSFWRPQGQRRKILCEAQSFPSDRFSLHSAVRLLGGDPKQDIVELGPQPGEYQLEPERILDTIMQLGEELALLYWNGVAYLSGQAYPIEALSRQAQAVGALSVFDLAHAAGNVSLALEQWGVDAACWCHYKYLNSGPGAVGGLYLHPRHHERGPALAGWWGHQATAQFGAGESFQPQAGAAGWETSTPNILSLATVRTATAIPAGIGMDTIARAGAALCAEAMGQLRDRGYRLLTPDRAHGAMLNLYAGDQAERLFAKLQASGILGDLRPPGILRFAFAPLYNGPDDLARLLHALDDPGR